MKEERALNREAALLVNDFVFLGKGGIQNKMSSV
jgi:hypothetical protein